MSTVDIYYSDIHSIVIIKRFVGKNCHLNPGHGRHGFEWLLYSGDLKNGPVWYSSHEHMFICQMVHSSNGDLFIAASSLFLGLLAFEPPLEGLLGKGDYLLHLYGL